MKNLNLLVGIVAVVIADAGCKACDSKYPHGPVSEQGDCPDGLCETGARAGSVIHGTAAVEGVPREGIPPAEALITPPSE